MSRSNDWKPFGIYDWRGTPWWVQTPNTFPDRVILGRRTWHRKQKYGDERGRCQWPPPKWWWKIHRKQARAKQKQEMRQYPEDPVITPMVRLVNLRSW